MVYGEKEGFRLVDSGERNVGERGSRKMFYGVFHRECGNVSERSFTWLDSSFRRRPESSLMSDSTMIFHGKTGSVFTFSWIPTFVGMTDFLSNKDCFSCDM